jgi:hypothetical protein
VGESSAHPSEAGPNQYRMTVDLRTERVDEADYMAYA